MQGVSVVTKNQHRVAIFDGPSACRRSISRLAPVIDRRSKTPCPLLRRKFARAWAPQRQCNGGGLAAADGRTVCRGKLVLQAGAGLVKPGASLRRRCQIIGAQTLSCAVLRKVAPGCASLRHIKAFYCAAKPSVSCTSLPVAAGVFSGAPAFSLAAGVPSCCKAAKIAALRCAPSVAKASAGSG
ncbi:hypothetical protein RCH05_000500 [Janthinobacterium sp. CAN_S7]